MPVSTSGLCYSLFSLDFGLPPRGQLCSVGSSNTSSVASRAINHSPRVSTGMGLQLRSLMAKPMPTARTKNQGLEGGKHKLATRPSLLFHCKPKSCWVLRHPSLCWERLWLLWGVWANTYCSPMGFEGSTVVPLRRKIWSSKG